MKQSNSRAEEEDASLAKAKRRFVANLCTFACLALIIAFFVSRDEEDSEETESVELIAPAATPLSKQEFAYLSGQVFGLSQHPETMPDYEAEWVAKLSEQEIRRKQSFKDVNETEIQELTQLFFKGYTERFDDYYDGQDAREHGYKIGVRMNPILRMDADPPNMYPSLTQLKEKFWTTYQIEDEAQWQLFRQAFQRGVNEGYYVIEEEVTMQHFGEKIQLFEL